MHSNQSLAKLPTAKDLASRIRNVTDDLLGIAHDVAAALEIRPELSDELVAEGVNQDLISRLERLGRKEIHPRLVFSTTPGGEKLLQLPLSQQERALTDGVEVLDPDETTTRIIPINDLTRPQATQVFAHGRKNGRIRSIAEQRTWIRANKAKKASLAPECGYRVCKDAVITTAPGKWSKRLILQWLTEMS